MWTISKALILSFLLAGIASAQVVTGGGGGSSLAGQFSVKTYGAIGDARSDNAIGVTGGQPTITAADSPWVSTDVGKLIFCVFTGTPTNGFVAGTKIQTFTDANHVTLSNNAIGGTATYICTWATQDDTAAFQAAFTAAKAATGSADPPFGSPTLSYQGTIYVPPGGYMLSGNIYDFNPASGNTLAPSFIGAGSSSVVLYPRSDTFTAGPRACLMNSNGGTKFTWSGFSVFGSSWGFNCGAVGVPFIRHNVPTYLTMRDIEIFNVGASNGGAAPILNILQGQQVYLNHVDMSNSSTNNTSGALLQVDNSASVLIEQSFYSNNTNGPNVVFNNSGARNASGLQVSMVGGGSDECGGSPGICVKVSLTSVVNFVGISIFGEPSGAGNGALTVDGTSSAYLSSVNVGPFNTNVNSNGIAIASGGFVYSTGSHIRGGGTTGSVIDAPAGATFIDDGGNTYQRCASTVCTNITAATYSGAFTSGIVPKSSLTHTPNTCYAVTGNLLATAQNICTLLLDQNYQLANLAAQSGGTTPTNSSCATPPVITLSDGTRSATMTMTSGQTVWCSVTSGGCTASSTTNPNQVFASGSLLTVSIGANTCATPPANVSVNYVLQSVLNP